MKPIIGITILEDSKQDISRLKNNYIEAINKAGGIPLLIPIIKDIKDTNRYLDPIDGLVLSGGEDILPSLFGEDPMEEVKYISYERDLSEINLFKNAFKRKIPILGICRGLQIANVAFGGDLYQDIPKQVENPIGHLPDFKTTKHGYHRIKIEKDTIMYEIFKDESILVNSQHHQSIKNLADEFIVSSRTSDGIIESIESRDPFFLGLQFHPEAMVENHPEFLEIFKKFIKKSVK